MLTFRSLLLAGLLFGVGAAWAQTEKPADAPAAKEEKSSEKPGRDPAEWAPADALFYVGIDDVKEFLADFEKTASYKMMNDKVLADSVPGMDVFAPVMKEIREQLGKALDTDPEQLKNPFAGPMAAYVVLPQGSNDPNAVYPALVATVGDKALMKKYYDSAVAKLKDLSTYETEKAGEFSIDVFKADPAKRAGGAAGAGEEEDAEPDFSDPSDPTGMISDAMKKAWSPERLPESLAACLADDRLVVGATAADVKAVLGKSKRSDALSEASDYKMIQRRMKPAGPVRFVVNMPRMLEMAKSAEDSAEAQESLQKTMRMLGAEGLRSAVGHMRVGASSYDSKFELLFLMSGERSGLAKLLSMENKAIAPPDSVTTEACVFGSANINVPQLMDEIERMVRQSDPAAADQMRSAMEAVPLPGSAQPVNIRKELIDHLGGPLTFRMAISKPVAPGAVRLLLSLGHRDQSALARFFTALAGMLTPRDIRGAQGFDVAFPPGISIVPTSDQLLIGNTPAVEAAMQTSAGDKLAESEMWRKLARFVPEQTWFTLFIDNRRLIESAIECSKSQQSDAAGQIPDMGTMMLMGMVEGVDVSRPEVTRKLINYATASIMTITTTDDGVQFTGVTLNPQQ